jgi:hypothetical protein
MCIIIFMGQSDYLVKSYKEKCVLTQMIQFMINKRCLFMTFTYSAIVRARVVIFVFCYNKIELQTEMLKIESRIYMSMNAEHESNQMCKTNSI